MVTNKGDIVQGLKNTYDDIIPAVDAFFYQWNPSIAIRMEEICGDYVEKNSFIWSHSMRVS